MEMARLYSEHMLANLHLDNLQELEGLFGLADPRHITGEAICSAWQEGELPPLV